MNQGELDVVKQEMAIWNIDSLGISKLKWTGMGEFNSDDHYIYDCGWESLRRNGIAITVNKSLKCSTWVQSQKQQNDLCLLPRQTIEHHSNRSLCPKYQCQRSWSWSVLGKCRRLPRINQDNLHIIEAWKAKVGSQEIPGEISKFGLLVQNEAGQSTSWEMLGWKKHKLESRMPGEMSITSDMQMIPSLWQKWRRT